MALTMYHNPRCSKSQKTLQILEESGIHPAVVEYLRNPPDAQTILRLAALLGMPVAGLVRRGDAEYREASDCPDLDDDAALASWIEKHPAVLQRPIVVDATARKAVIGRPPENVLGLLGA